MKNSILGKARWLRDVALATSKNNGARVAQEWLKYAAMLVMLFTLGVGNAWGAEETITFSSSTSTTSGSGNTFTITWTNGTSCTIDQSRGTSNTNVANYTTAPRWYQNHLITFTPRSGYTISTVVITASSSNNGQTMTFESGSGSIVNTSSTVTTVTGSWSSAFTLKMGKQCRPSTVKITYTASASSHTLSSAVSPSASGSVSLSATSVTEGSTATATATPATHYVFDHWSISGTGSTLSSTTANPTTITMGTANTTVTATFVAAPKASITLSEAGATTTDASTYYVGDSYTLPSSTGASCGTKVLVGWSTVEVAETNTKPTSNFYEKGASVTLAASQTFYAVFATASGGGSSDMEIDFEGLSSTYSDWTFTNLTSQQTNANVTAHGGSYFGSTDATATASIKTNSKVDPQSLTVYFTKQTTNTTSSTWYIQVSSDGSSWTDVTTQSATSMSRGTWVEVESDLSDYSDVYVRVYYSGSTAVRNIDDLTLTIGGGTTYSAYSTTCCTPLGSIKGSVSLSQLASPDPTKLKATWTMNASTGIASYTLEVYDNSDNLVKTINNYTSEDEITGLNPCTTYYVKLYTVSSGTVGLVTYCDGGLISTSSTCTTNGWGVSESLTNTTHVTGASTACPASNYVATYTATTGNVLPSSVSVSIGGVSKTQGTHYTWSVSNGTGTLTILAANITNSTGAISITISSAAASCSNQYTFAYGATPNADGKNIDGATKDCFSRVGSTNEYQITGFTIPTTTQYFWVGYNGYFYDDGLGSNNASSSRNQFKYMPVANLQGSSCGGTGDSYKHAATGAYGTLRIFSNYSDNNLYVGFVPAGYQMRVGSGSTWSNIQLTQSDGTVWTSELVTLDAALIAKNYYVNVWTGASYNSADAGVAINNWTDGGSTISSMAFKTGADTWDTSSGLSAGMRGKFRSWADNCANNGYAHFVPYYHVTYNGNGASGSVAASTDVSCEGNEAARTVKAAANGFTVPAHTTFGGWATSAGGAKVYDPNDDIVLTADVELFAIWTPEANATITLNNYTGTAAPTDKYAGESWNLPSANSFNCNDKTFVGWSTIEVAETDTKPSSNFYEPGASVTLAATNTFYAVFADVEEVVDTLYYDKIGVTGSSYISWSDKTSESSAVYAGQSAGGDSNSGDAIQLRSNNSNSGIVTTASGGKIQKIRVVWNSYTTNGRTLNIYGAKRAYTAPTELYGANIKGVLLGTIVKGTSTELTPTADSTFIGMRSNGSAMYIDTIYITWGGSSNYSTNCAACNEITLSYSDPGNGNTMIVKQGSTAKASGSTVKTCSATSLTVTLTAASHYSVTGFTATGVTGVTTSNVGNVYTVNIPQDKTGTLTLTPTFTAETPLTINFIATVSGATVGSIGDVYSGDSFEFPSVSNLPVGFCADFLGWVDFTNGETFDGDGTRTTAPDNLLEVGDNSGAITTNKTYKAVYGEPESEETEAYAKVTASQDDWSGDYLIVHEGSGRALDGSLGTTTVDAQGNYFSVTISAGTITGDYTTKQWTIAKIGSTSTYTIKGASGCYIGRSAASNGLDRTTTVGDADANTIAYSSGITITGSGGPTLQYLNTSGQERFRYYASSQQAISLFKLGTTTVTTYTYTTAPSCGDKYRVTVADATGGSPSASPKYCADGTTISLVANPANGYSFTRWTITKDGTNPLQDVTSTLLTGSKPTTASTSFTMPAYDVTVTATYGLTNYSITYNNLNGATNTNPATYNVTSADIVFVDPGERSGYVFKGWYDDNVFTNLVTGIPNGSTGAVTVYAKWVVGYTITWSNGVGDNPASTGVEDGQAIGTLPTPTGSCEVDGTTYSNFVGWYTGTISGVGTAASDAGTEITGATVPTASVTYHAVYTNMADYSDTHTSNVTLPASPSSPVSTAKIKLSSEDDAPEYDGIKIGTNGTKTGSFTFTVPSGTTKITVHATGWNGKTTSITLATSVGTITPSTAQSLTASSGATANSPFTITSGVNTLNFTLTGVTSTATITLSNSSERVIVWGINASSASGEDVGYITQCCDNMLAAPVVTGTANSSTQITLSWPAVTGATGYKVSWNGGDWEDLGTTRSYVKTGLEPGETYLWKVIGKYNAAQKCGAETASGTTTTKSVYHVTYVGGSGTGTCTATHVPTDNTAYEAGQTVTLPATSGEGAISLAGHTFAAWTSSDVTIAPNASSFVMPEGDVTVTATWTAKVDKYYDNMHDLTATDPDTGDPGTQDGAHYYITREGCKYHVPALSDNTSGATACHTTHYVLLGWIAQSYLESDGTVSEANKSHITTGGGEKTATGATYYAVWAIVE